MPRAKSTLTRPLSDLEGAVLGVVGASDGPSPYAIRQEFLKSPAPYWSGSAGAIYPLVRRLVRVGLLRQTETSQGDRRGSALSLTARGRAALNQWLSAEPNAATIGIPMDPLRLRVRFLHALEPKTRAGIVARAIEQASTHLSIIEDDCRRRHAEGNLPAYLIAKGATLMMQSRLAWLEEVREVYRHREPAARRAAGLKV